MAHYLKGESRRFNHLDQRLSDLILGRQSHQANLDIHYQWFGKLVLELERIQQRHGVALKELFKKLRLLMIDDYRISRELSEIRNSCLIQQAVIIFIVWTMILMSSAILERELHLLDVLSIVIWQIMGVISFCFIFLKSKLHLFKEITQITKVSIKLLVYTKLSLPLQQVTEQSHIESILRIKKSKYLPIIDNLKQVLNKLRTYGVDVSKELELILDELHFLTKQKQEKLKKLSEGSKLAHLVFFQLLCYFFYLYKLTNSMLTAS